MIIGFSEDSLMMDLCRALEKFGDGMDWKDGVTVPEDPHPSSPIMPQMTMMTLSFRRKMDEDLLNILVNEYRLFTKLND